MSDTRIRLDARLAPSVDYIADVQRRDGLIPWFPGGPADPWDHVESAMGLSIGGRYGAARRAYEWLARAQHDDGGWWAAYGDTEASRDDHDGDEPRKEPHRSAYVAVGAHLHYRATRDRSFLDDFWTTIRDAVEFALEHQAPSGEVYWAVDADGQPYEDALVAACASVYKSLESAAVIADVLGYHGARRRWLDARSRLGTAIRERPERFDRTWESKSGYAMDWFYPVLCGVVDGDEARARLDDADGFVEEGVGCRCVADEPWVTVAESCELVISLESVGRHDRAREMFGWLFDWTDDDGVFWTGYQFEDDEFWPHERPTWTAGAVLLAADALSGTRTSTVFTDHTRERPHL